MSSQQPSQAPAAASETNLTATQAAATTAVPAATPAAEPTATPARPTTGNEATLPVDEQHNSRNMMHFGPANRGSNVSSLDFKNNGIQGAASKMSPKSHKKLMIQNNIKNLQFSIEAILSKNDNIHLSKKKSNQKQEILNLKLVTLKHSSLEGQSSELMANSVQPDPNRIGLHGDNNSAKLEIQQQQVTSSPSPAPAFEAAAADAADVAATVAAMTAVQHVHPYVANLDRGSIPTATLHYMPLHPHTGQQLQSHGGHSQHQSHQGIIPEQPITRHTQAPRSAAPSLQAPRYHTTPPETAMQPPSYAAPQPPRNAAPQPPRNAAPSLQSPQDEVAPLRAATPMSPRLAAPSQQPPQDNATPTMEVMQPPCYAALQPPRHAAPSLQATQYGAMHMTGHVYTPHHAAPSPYGAAPTVIDQATRQKERHMAGDTRIKCQASSTGTIAKHAHAQDAPRDVRSYPLLGLSREQQMGHNLPVALMPTRQQSRPQALAQHYIIGRRLHEVGMDPCKNVQNQSLAATRPQTAYPTSPVPSRIYYPPASPHNEMLRGLGPIRQGQIVKDFPQKSRNSLYTPTWHLNVPSSLGNAQPTYVARVPAAAMQGTGVGQVALPPHVLAPPPPPPLSPLARHLISTPLTQSGPGATSEIKASGTAEAIETELHSGVPPPCPQLYRCVPPPMPAVPQARDRLLMPPPWQPPKSQGAGFSRNCENRKMRSPIGMVSITERMANMQSMYGQNAGPIDGNMTNDSDSNFQETALQKEDSNVNIWKNPINQGQLSQDVKEVIPNQGSNVNQNITDPTLIIDKDAVNPGSGITQNLTQSGQYINDVIGNQVSHVNSNKNQHNTNTGSNVHMSHEHEQSPSLFSITNKDHDDMMDHEVVQIKPEVIESQPDIDYITMTNSDDEEDELISEEHPWEPPPIKDRKKLLYDEESKAYKLSSIQLKAARAMLDKEVAELDHKSVTQMLQNPKTTSTAYTDIFVEKDYESPLYLSSFVIDSPGCNDKFKCQACNTEYKIRQSFRVHHRRKIHINNFEHWIKIKERQNLLEPLHKKPRISQDAITLAKKAIAYYRQIHGMAQNEVFIASNINQDVVPSQSGSDQEFQEYTRASLALKQNIPAYLSDFKKNILNVLSIIYFDRNNRSLDIHFDHMIGRQNHWILVMFKKLKARPQARKFIQERFDQGDLSFVKKSPAQLEETKEINGMARLLFPIFLKCQFIPTSYIILMAVLMNTNNEWFIITTSTYLNNRSFIDLLVNSGVAKLKPTVSNPPIQPPETEIQALLESANTNRPRIVHDSQIHPPETEMQANMVHPDSPIHPPETEIQTERVHQDNTDSNKTFIEGINHHIEDDLLLLQTTLNEDVELINDSKRNNNIDTSSWSLEDQHYQNSSNSTSTSTIPTIHEVIDSDDMEEEDSNQHQDQADDHQQELVERSQEDHPDVSTIYVPNLPRETTKEDLIPVFNSFGIIKEIQLKTLRRSKKKNAIVIFSNQHNARSAMLSLNSTTYKHRKNNVRMSRDKSFMSIGNQLDVPPVLPVDIPEMQNLTIKKNNKRKLVPDNNSLDVNGGHSQSHPCSDPSDEEVQTQTQFEDLDDKSTPPDPIALAQNLFMYWQQYLNFHIDMENTESDMFAQATLDELSILVSENSTSTEMEEKME